MTTIAAKIELEHGSLLTAANADWLFARRVDRGGPKNPAGPETWHCKSSKDGFIFRSNATGYGLCGHHSTVRGLVIATLCGFPVGEDFEVFYDRPEVPV